MCQKVRVLVSRQGPSGQIRVMATSAVRFRFAAVGSGKVRLDQRLRSRASGPVLRCRRRGRLRRLSTAYLAAAGQVLHHNVDKAFLGASRATPLSVRHRRSIQVAGFRRTHVRSVRDESRRDHSAFPTRF